VSSVLFALFLATSTLCQTVEVTLPNGIVDLRLKGCGDGFTENTLWHLDRGDSVRGTLDGRADRQATGKGALVYVLDTGVMRDHDEFSRGSGTNVIAGIDPASHWNETTACRDGRMAAVQPCNDYPAEMFLWTHGTSVASMIGGRFTGVAPDANLVSVFTMHRRNSEAEAMLHALGDVVANAWDPGTPQVETVIVNMSQSLSRDVAGVDAVEAMIRQMVDGVDASGNPDSVRGKRFFFTAVAGNAEAGGPGQCTADRGVALFPGVIGRSIDGLITVGAIGPSNEVWDLSCSGDLVEVYAPGVNVLVASMGGRDLYRSGNLQYGIAGNSGTSYSAPYVAGLAALLLEANPLLTPRELELAIKSGRSRTADHTKVVATYDIQSKPRRRAARQ
jgi:subtilisin family serine protease